MLAGLLPDSASIEANHLAIISHGLSSTAVEVFEAAGERHVDVGHGLGKNFIESAEGSAEVGTLDLSAFRVYDLAEWVLL